MYIYIYTSIYAIIKIYTYNHVNNFMGIHITSSGTRSHLVGEGIQGTLQASAVRAVHTWRIVEK